MKVIKDKRKNIGKYFFDGVMFLVGSFLYALSVNIFSFPNSLVPGGVTGIGILLKHSFSIPIGLTMMIINIPLVILAFRKFGASVTVRTAVATFFTSVFIDITAPFLKGFEGDMILVALFGGALSGLGLGLIYMRGGTTGGTELMTRLLEPHIPHIPVGRIILVIDIVVVGASILVFHELTNALYSVVLIFVTTSIMDTIIYGQKQGKMVLIMSNCEKEIAEKIITTMNRGVTKLKAGGAYTGEDRKVLLCAVRSQEFYELKNIVYSIDPTAFMVITTADDVFGEGFRVPDKHKQEEQIKKLKEKKR